MIDHAADRPWRRDGAVAYAIDRLRRTIAPPVIVEPAVSVGRKMADCAIAVRDGTILRANVYLPRADGPFPVLLCAHPYGKDALPRRTRSGRYRINPQYRALRQPAPVRISDETGWEAPDPAWWAEQGYALVNLDVRGAGHSEGVGSLLSAEEADDIHDVIEWIAAQSWCDGGVGMLGVSYLAISQYRAAASRPPHLRAIVPWEGFTNAYRDLFYPGGVREIGFSRLWTTITRHTTRMAPDVGEQAAARPDEDDWWRSLEPDLARIEVPMLVCGSFSDNNLHTRGSFRAFAEASSSDRHLYTHRGGKWATFYGDDAKRAQRAFLDTHLKGAEPTTPRVRLEVRERRDLVHSVREVDSWPPPGTTQRPLWLAAESLMATAAPEQAASVAFRARTRAATFTFTFDHDAEIIGPAALTVWLRADRDTEAHVFAGISKWSKGRFVPFEGSYGFGRDLVTTGWRRVGLGLRSCPVEVELGPSATFFRSGDELRLHVSGRQLSARNPVFGAAPALYARSHRARWSIEWGPKRPSALHLPFTP